MVRNIYLRELCYGAAAIAAVVPAAALGQTHSFNVPAQDAARGVAIFARQADIQLLISARDARGRRTNAVKGSLSVEEGLHQLLDGTGLEAKFSGPRTFTLVLAASAASQADSGLSRNVGAEVAAAAPEPVAPPIVVTGTRIRGTPQASPVITITSRKMREAGQYDLGDVIRSIPQNFSGGQNPGVVNHGGSQNDINYTDGSSLDLRGLGPDATLTLLNGKRLAYASFTQAVDISAIPIAAVDRIEVVADGASAIYGSDAVAGVANVILRHDFSGVSLGARSGTATEGGGTQREADVVAGTTWSSGGFLASYDYEKSDAIRADQRSYLAYMLQPYWILGSTERNNALFTGHQKLGPVLTFSIDAMYNQRTSRQDLNNGVSAARPSLSEGRRKTENYFVAPTLEAALGAWRVDLVGVYGHERAVIDQRSYNSSNVLSSSLVYCLCNKTMSGELNAEGPLVSLPGGTARLALGGGYRRTSFVYDVISQNVISTHGDWTSRYAFGELYVPLVSPSLHVPFVNSLSLTGAVRHEDYSGIGTVTTPKLGAIYAPTADFDLRASWSRSFKAPTLWQGKATSGASLFHATTVGGVGLPAAATVIYLSGGSDLKPERARTWTATLAFHPRAVAALHAELSYFDVAYKDRILTPVVSSAALSNPVFSDFVIRNPTVAQQQQAIAQSSVGLFDGIGVPYDPANVVAIVDNRYLNVARQTLHGLDAMADWSLPYAGGTLNLSGNASWLWSKQQNSTLAPVFALAGTVFNPPRLRARGGIGWSSASFTFSAFANYAGGLTDIRTVPSPKGESMVTFDAAILWRPQFAKGLELSLAVSNLTDARPPYLRSTSPSQVNYDSTNYSAVGRFVNVSILQHW